MGYVKKTVSFPEELYDEAVQRARRMRYPSFSEYVQYLIHQDLEEKPKHSIVREEHFPEPGHAEEKEPPKSKPRAA